MNKLDTIIETVAEDAIKLFVHNPQSQEIAGIAVLSIEAFVGLIARLHHKAPAAPAPVATAPVASVA